MTVVSASCRIMLFLVTCVWLTGCSRLSETEVDEQKDPHYLAGKSRLNSMNYAGAVESFEKALETNPKSAAAHFELGLLYEQRMADHARALYHYEQHLRLRPDSSLADTVRARIISCKIEIAKTVQFAFVPPSIQDELNRLNATNTALRQASEQLRGQLEQSQTLLGQAQAQLNQTRAELEEAKNRPAPAPAPQVQQSRPAPQHASVSQVRSNTPSTSAPVGSGRSAPTSDRSAKVPEKSTKVSPPSTSTKVSPPSTQTPSISPAKVVPPTTKRHAVRRGDTLGTIAKQYGVSLTALQAANPGIDPRKLKEGQSVVIPGSRM